MRGAGDGLRWTHAEPKPFVSESAVCIRECPEFPVWVALNFPIWVPEFPNVSHSFPVVGAAHVHSSAVRPCAVT